MNVYPAPVLRSCSKVTSGGTTAVIAAYNEAKTIGQVIAGVRKHTPGLVEIIVVDDGSVDDTAEMAAAAGAVVTRLPENRGKGVALRNGLDQVSTELILTIDGDGQDDPSEIPSLVAQMDDQVDMVIGSRFLGTFYKEAIEPINKIGNRALTWFFDKLYRVNLTDTQAGFRLFRAGSLNGSSLRSRAYEIETELTARVLVGGGRIVEVPVSRYARSAGSTSFCKIYHGLRILKTMVAIRTTLRRG